MEMGKWCRICMAEIGRGVFLFGEEAKRSFLQAKMRRYLAISISFEEQLPKMVCDDCVGKLDGIHKFATMAIKNQEKMKKYFIPNSVSLEANKIENKSLLQSYLTKGIEKECFNDSEITKMEVRVDPMSILQCLLDEEDDHDDKVDKEKESDKDSENENTENVIYLCSICKKSYTTEYALQDHMHMHSVPHNKRILNGFHNVRENNTNGICMKEDKKDITEVRESDGDSHKLCSCPICGKSASTKGHLKVHLETHRPKGKYACDICGRVFKTQCNLCRHKEYHEGVQFPCEVCGRVYPTNSTLRAHSITHSDLRPHKCPLCDKTFKRNQDLKFHINQHTGARPYQCPYCPKAFASSGNCFSHRKRMHPMEVERDRENAAKIMR